MNKNRRQTAEEINSWLASDGRGIIMTGEYLNGATKTTFKCQHPEHPEWHSTPNHIKRGSGCPSCSGNHRPTTKEFNEWLTVNNRGITILGEYTNNSTKTKFQCWCSHEWDATPNSIKNGSGCPQCASMKTKRRITTELMSDWLLENNSGISIVGEYLGSDKKTLFKCNIYDEHPLWSARPNDIKKGSGCPCCAKHGFNPAEPGTFYAWTKDNYLKVGITNDLPRRLDEHRKRNGDITLIYVQDYLIGRDAQIRESNFKKNHGGGYVTKEECPDGYTETFPIEIVKWLQC